MTIDIVYECMKELYLKSKPSIDITKSNHTINPNKHVIKISEFDAILKKYELKLNQHLIIFLNKGPKMIEG